jgi:hypothetical protein
LDTGGCMSEFIRVLGDDPFYKGRKILMYLAVHSVQKVCPIFGVKRESGEYWRCLPDHDGAEIVSYQLTDFAGTTYSCGNAKELEKLGIVEPQPKAKIGFLNQEDDERLQVDMRAQ